MRIGDLAASAQIPPDTVRYYEKRGLLAPPTRAANGYRTYDEAALHQLRFIRSAQAAGLTLAEIRSVIELRTNGTAPCRHVESLLADKLAAVRSRQAQLVALEHDLVPLLERSSTLDPMDCQPDDICHVVVRAQPMDESTGSPQN
jgi:DNA-binding transcriptional MerR regulator